MCWCYLCGVSTTLDRLQEFDDCCSLDCLLMLCDIRDEADLWDDRLFLYGNMF